MNHLIIHGSTDRIRKTFVSLEARQSARVADQLFRHMIEVQRCHAGLNLIAKRIKHTVQQRARFAHLLYL